MEYRVLSDKLRLLQAKTPEVPLAKEICFHAINAVLRKDELAGVPDAMNMVQKFEPLHFVGALVPPLGVSEKKQRERTPIQNSKAGKAI